MRVFERLASPVLALAVIAGSLLLAVEVAWAAAGQRPLLIPWRRAYTSGSQDAWDSSQVRVVAIVVLAVGLILLLAELTPRRTRRLVMSGDDPTFDAAITRKSLGTVLQATANGVDGLTGAKAKVGARTTDVSARSRLSSTSTVKALNGELDATLRSRLGGLQLANPPALRTRVTPRADPGSS